MARTSSGWWHSPEMLVADGACRCVLDRRGIPAAQSTSVTAVAAAAEPSSATPRRWGLGWLHARACQC